MIIAAIAVTAWLALNAAAIVALLLRYRHEQTAGSFDAHAESALRMVGARGVQR